MIRIVAVAFILAAGATAYAMPRASIHQADSLVTTVREASVPPIDVTRPVARPE